ncbi:MmyB family transcriptional regulator [Klebsiella quasipneumoniae]
MLSSFRRDFTRASQSTDIPELVNDLERISPAFKLWWRQQQVQAPCHGVRH